MKREPLEVAQDLVKIARTDYGKKWGPRDVELFELAEDYIALTKDYEDMTGRWIEAILWDDDE